jgi:hypothetical protein
MRRGRVGFRRTGTVVAELRVGGGVVVPPEFVAEDAVGALGGVPSVALAYPLPADADGVMGGLLGTVERRKTGHADDVTQVVVPVVRTGGLVGLDGLQGAGTGLDLLLRCLR